jgi:hypothetical protein
MNPKRKLTNSPVSAVIILVAGVATFFSGISNPFIGDDNSQIVNSLPVHSITNIGTFFTSGTFYAGNDQLGGPYYRPLMITVYSLLYTIFGPNPLYFHLFQLLLCVSSAIILYFFFRYSFKPALALPISLIFLVHPINSQVVFAMPKMGDALFFFFGILALWLLIRFHSIRSLLAVAVCLLLSLLAKETGILFVAMALVYLIGFNRGRLYPFIGIMLLPIALYVALDISSTGLNHNPYNSPIDNLDLGGRLLTAPSIVLFYLTKFVWPLQLASAYYWVHPTFSFQYFVLPLAVDLAVIAGIVYIGSQVRNRGTKAQHRTFWFFATWLALGLIAHLQIIPLDMTVSENWFYFPMVGILGMTGITLSIFAPSIRVDRRIFVAIISVLIVLLGIRTAARGADWSNEYTLAQHDVAVSPEDYSADVLIAGYLDHQGNLAGAREYANNAVSAYKTGSTYNALGSALYTSGDYAQAKQAYLTALTYQQVSLIYDNLASLTLYYGDPSQNRSFLISAVQMFPQDGTLWLRLAVFDQRNHDNADAKVAISNAYTYGAGNQVAYTQIMNDAPITIPSRPELPSAPTTIG